MIPSGSISNRMTIPSGSASSRSTTTITTKRAVRAAEAAAAAAIEGSNNITAPPSFVPPMARRRMKHRERRRAKAKQRQLLMMLGLFCCFIMLKFNIMYFRRSRNQQLPEQQQQVPEPPRGDSAGGGGGGGGFGSPNQLRNRNMEDINNSVVGEGDGGDDNPSPINEGLIEEDTTPMAKTTTKKKKKKTKSMQYGGGGRRPLQQPSFPRWKDTPGHQKPPPPQPPPKPGEKKRKKKKKNNLRHNDGGGDDDDDTSTGNNNNINKKWISEESQPFNMNLKATNTHHLIIVAGHSVTISGHLYDAGIDENDWYLLDYQRGHGLPQAIISHIKSGIQQAKQDVDSLLIFSGGETRPITGPISEGSSYFHVADAMNLWDDTDTDNEGEGVVNESISSPNTVRARTVTEEFATDSFENL